MIINIFSSVVSVNGNSKMKICWDNLNKLYYDNNLLCLKDKHNNSYHFIDECITCFKSFIGGLDSKYCSVSCVHKGKLKSKEHRENMSKARKGIIFTKEHLDNMSKAMLGEKNPFYGKTHSKKTRKIISLANKNKILSPKTIKKIVKKTTMNKIDYKKKHPFFYEIEEIRNNPNKLGIQVRCRNHNCKNSKEQNGWFTPTKIQLAERIRVLEHSGFDGNYFYCCNKCKRECPMFHLGSGRTKKELYTSAEYQTFRQQVLKREDYLCEYCEEKANTVHHIRPQKLEPFFSLDPDFGVSCCMKCHYKYGHKDECGTGIIANKECL